MSTNYEDASFPSGVLPPVAVLETKSVDHLGLLAAALEHLDFINLVDTMIPVDPGSGVRLTMGQRLAGMIMNGLGFVNTRLYMTPEFFEKKPVERLFGADVKASFFNDDSLGRCLDAIYDYGPTKFLSEIAFAIGVEKGLLGKVLHTDTTTLSYYGDREDDDEDSEDQNSQEKVKGHCAKPKYGYAKNKRMDLRQMTLLMSMTGKANLPIFAQALDGNASDKVTLQEAAQRVQAFQKALNKNLPELLCVSDSAGYEAFLAKGNNLLWLSRVPETHTQAKDYVMTDDKDLTWTQINDMYKMTSKTLTYKAVEQRWVMVFSKQAYKRECLTLDKAIKKEKEEMTKALASLSRHGYGCEKDAQDALRKLTKKLKYHLVSSIVLTSEMKHKKPGRPTEGSQRVVDCVKIAGVVEADDAKQVAVRSKKGRFILATNQMDTAKLSDAEILLEYKGQSKVEAGFKFLKNDAFEVSKIFLKNDKRINALMIVMVLCLMVYNYMQFYIRDTLEKKKETIPSQTKREIQNPTMAYIGFLFNGLAEVTMQIGHEVRKEMPPVKDVVRRIIEYFGPTAMRIYGVMDSG